MSAPLRLDHPARACVLTLLLLTAGALPGCLSCGPSPPPTAPAAIAPGLETVTQVLDGDTVAIGGERIRLKGINAAETGECGAASATAALTAFVARGVRVDRRGKDRYDRTLGYLFDPENVGAHVALAESGLVLAYPYGDHDDQAAVIAASEARARSAARGLFAPDACGAPVVPAGTVTFSAIDSDPPGDDLAPEGGESVTIRGPVGTSLAGFVLKDTSASNRFTFPGGATLSSQGELRVFTACGSPAPDRLFWCHKRSGVWNQGGDTAFLLDPRGNLVTERSYGRPGAVLPRAFAR